MQSLEQSKTISEPMSSVIDTGAVYEETLSSGESHQERLAWERLIDGQLIEWGRNPEQLEDDDIEAPSREIISVASTLALTMCRHEMPAPSRIAPDGEGGIVFEHREGRDFETFEIHEDGSIEYLAFHDSQLVDRQTLR